MNQLCQQVQIAAIVCLAAAYLCWAPYAIRERFMPWKLKGPAAVLVTAGVLLAAFGMPWYCQMCEIR